jgi:hypothetical protein
MMALDARHLDTIRAVLAAIPDDTPAARAALACEDAYVACRLGVSLGLSFADVKRLAVELLTEDDPLRGERP